MDERTWYLGPPGDMRGLISPDGGVDRTVERYGGVHQALSGARTMDITGHRASYTLPVSAVTPTESRFVEALHQRTVPGPYRLLDPLARNRLPREVAMLKPSAAELRISGGGTARDPQAPAEVGVPVTSLQWGAYTAGSSVSLPGVPVLDGETITMSVWAAATETITAAIRIAFTGADGQAVAIERHEATLATAFNRIAVAVAVPDGAATATVSFAPEVAGRVWLAAAQIEDGGMAGEWDLGGGAPTVVIDQLERSSPIYPLNDLTLTLLEV